MRFVKDAQKQEEMWEKQHEIGAEKMYSLCSELGGLFLKVISLISVLLLLTSEKIRNF